MSMRLEYAFLECEKKCFSSRSDGSTLPQNQQHREQSDPCSKKQKTKFAECASGVVYEIPLSCGTVYIAQRGRCLNDRASEHAAAMRASPSGLLASHCNICLCTHVLHDIKLLAR